MKNLKIAHKAKITFNHYKQAKAKTIEETRKVALNKKVLDAMGVTKDNRDVFIDYDIEEKRITISLIN